MENRKITTANNVYEIIAPTGCNGSYTNRGCCTTKLLVKC